MPFTRRSASLGVTALMLFAVAPGVMAQQPQPSLADVAKAEQQRRGVVTRPSRVYTNADLPVVVTRGAPSPILPPPVDLPPVVPSTEPANQDVRQDSVC